MRRCWWFLTAVVACLSSVTFAVPAGESGGPQLVIQKGHIGAITGLNFIAHGRTLISSSNDMTIKIWDVQTGIEIRTLPPHDHWINAIDVNPSETLVASGSTDKTVRVWEIATGRNLHVLDHTRKVRSVAFSPNGKRLVSVGDDGTIKLWDVASGDMLDSKIATPNYSVNSVDFNPADGTTFVAGLGNNSLQVWKVTAGRISLRKTIPVHGMANVVKFKGNGSLLATADSFGAGSHFIRLWNPRTWRQTKELKGHTDDINTLAFSPDGATLVSGSTDKTFALWDLKTYKRSWQSSPEMGVDAVSFADEGGNLATGGGGGVISIWDWRRKEPVSRFEVRSASATSARYSIDSGILVSVYADFVNWNTNLKVVNTFKDEPPINLSDTSGLTTSVGLSLDGQLLASGGDGHVVTLYELRTKKPLHVFKDHHAGIEAIAFSADGKKLASAAEDKTILVWDTKTFEQRDQFVSPFDSVASLTFDGKGRLLVGGISDSTLLVLDAADGHPVFRSRVTNLKQPTFNLAEKLLAGVDGNNNVTVQNASTGSSVKLGLDVGHVWNISFGETGQHLVSAEWDGSVRVWDVKAGQELFTFISLDDHDWLAVTPDGFFDGTPAAWRRVLWRFGGDTFDYAPVESFFDEFYRPGLIKEVMLGKIPRAIAGSGIQTRDRRLPRVKIESVSLVPAQRAKEVSADRAGRTTKLRLTVREAPMGFDKRRGRRMPAGGVRDVRLFRNGSLVRRWEGTLEQIASAGGCHKIVGPGGTGISCTATVPVVGGKNDFTAYAFNNDNVKSEDASLSVNPKGVEDRPGTLYVLAIGVNKYPSRPLEYAVCDAERLGREVRERQTRLGKEHAQYSETRVIHLLDEQATRENILLALNRLASPNIDATFLPPGSSTPSDEVLPQLAQLKPARPEDAVLLFFSGHGLSDSDIFYLLPYGVSAAPAAPGPIAAAQWLALIKDGAVSTQDLEVVLMKVDAGEVLMAIDACHSGQSLESEESRRGPLNSRGLAQLAYEKGMYILTASQGYEVAAERSDLGHGVLTYALIEGLRTPEANLNKDDIGLVTEREWMDYAARRVGELQQGEYERRVGMTEDTGCDLVIKDRKASGGGGSRSHEIVRDRRSGLERWHGKGVPEDEGSGEQRPRVYYRREEPARPLVVSIVNR